MHRRASLAMQDLRGQLDQPFQSVAGVGRTMMQDTDVQGLQSKAEARLASLKDEKLVTRIAVLSTSLGQGKTTNRLMIGMSSNARRLDFDQKSATKQGRIMQALGDIVDVHQKWIAEPAASASTRSFVRSERGAKGGRDASNSTEKCGLALVHLDRPSVVIGVAEAVRNVFPG
jgi:hypothetical protein